MPTPSPSFRLPRPSYGDYTWQLANGQPGSQPPLTRELFSGMWPRSGDSHDPPPYVWINGYPYSRVGPLPSERAHPLSVPPRDGLTPLTRWRTIWLPRVLAAVREAETFRPETVRSGEWRDVLADHAATFGAVHSRVHVRTVLPGEAAAQRFARTYAAAFGEDRRDDAFRLLQGFPNRNLDRVFAMWEISRMLPGEPELDAEAILHAPQFRTFLDEFGHTIDRYEIDRPTWREDPGAPVSIVRAFRLQDRVDPQRSVSRQRSERLALEKEIRALPSGQGSRLLELLARAQEFAPLLEDHNFYCDQALLAAVRARWLRVGSMLRRAGRVSRRDDVFFHTPEEILGVLEGDLTLDSGEVQRRREELNAHRAVRPPTWLGKAPPEGPWLPDPALRSQGRISLRGVGASSGVATGPAAVVRDAAAPSYDPGVVLVCDTLSPTVISCLAFASGLVTDSGGMLSHAAILARELGIPAVVGTHGATSHVEPGRKVTVDGQQGLVLIEG